MQAADPGLTDRQAILTGGSTKVTYTVDGPPAPMTTNYFVEVDGGDNGVIQECLEDNNGAVVTDAKCPIPG